MTDSQPLWQAQLHQGEAASGVSDVAGRLIVVDTISSVQFHPYRPILMTSSGSRAFQHPAMNPTTLMTRTFRRSQVTRSICRWRQTASALRRPAQHTPPTGDYAFTRSHRPARTSHICITCMSSTQLALNPYSRNSNAKLTAAKPIIAAPPHISWSPI
jgi:hypothetical protein